MNHLEEQRVSPNTQKKYLATLKLVLKTACTDGYIMRNPAEFVKPPRATKTEMDFLSPSEIGLLIENTQKEHLVLVATACYTGLRQAELLGITWDDIDFNAGYIYVRPNKIRDLKSDSSKRKVPMISELREAIKSHQLKQMVGADENPLNLVFINKAGKKLDASNIDNRVLKPALKLAGLRRIRWHDLRHSYATALLSNGEPLRYVSKLLGHADASITLRVYSHVLPETEIDAHDRHQSIFLQP